MEKKIAIDFGASRIKSISFTSRNKILDHFETVGSNYFKNKPINPIFFYNSFLEHLNYYDKNISFSKIILCSEMHGFSLLNNKNNKLSNYLSWRYQRNTSEIKNILKKLSEKKFQNLTGLKPRDGLPIINWLSKKNSIKKNFTLCGIGEILCVIGGKYSGNLHSTYAQSTGFFKLNNKYFLNEKVFLNNISSNKKNLIGTVLFKGKTKYISGGYGDLQTALYGSKIKKNEILINMGTGSQIILKNSKKVKHFEKRNYFNEIISCKTHIPSGRSLNIIAEKIDKLTNKKKSFWKIFNNISLNELEECKDLIDLDYLKLKKFLNTNKYKKNYKKFITIVLKSYCDQYVTYVNALPLKKYKLKNIILLGGIPRQIPVIKQYFKNKTNLNTIINKSIVDETLIGLVKLSKYNL